VSTLTERVAAMVIDYAGGLLRPGGVRYANAEHVADDIVTAVTAHLADPLTVETLADWLGAMPEARNVADYTDEATTIITIGVEQLAQRLAARPLPALSPDDAETLAQSVIADTRWAAGADPRAIAVHGRGVRDGIAARGAYALEATS
jgi:hypothetical protein